MFKICISDPKTRKTYQIEKEAVSLIGIKIGQKVDGGMLGLDGFTVQITGGSDKDGFPMRPEVDGPLRKKILLIDAPGFHPRFRGERKRKYVRGNQISADIAQVNCKIVEGEGDIEMMLGVKKESNKEETKKSEDKSSDTANNQKPTETKPKEEKLAEEKKPEPKKEEPKKEAPVEKKE